MDTNCHRMLVLPFQDVSTTVSTIQGQFSLVPCIYASRMVYFRNKKDFLVHARKVRKNRLFYRHFSFNPCVWLILDEKTPKHVRIRKLSEKDRLIFRYRCYYYHMFIRLTCWRAIEMNFLSKKNVKKRNSFVHIYFMWKYPTLISSS